MQESTVGKSTSNTGGPSTSWAQKLSWAAGSEWTQGASEGKWRREGDCAQVSLGAFGPVAMSSKTWNAATGDKSPELERQVESCVLEQPTAAAASCRSVLPRDSAVVFSHLGERGSSREEEAMGGRVYTCFCPLGKRNESFQEVKPSDSHAMNTLNRSFELSSMFSLLNKFKSPQLVKKSHADILN